MASASLTVLTGAMNFRDIGGLPTADGRQVRQGLVYRSGELNTLTDADLATLAALNIRYIFCTRTDPERAAAPTRWPENPPHVVCISVGFDAKEDPAASMKQWFAQGIDPASVTAAMRGATAKIAIDGASAIGQILQQLAHVEEPAIIHCTAGKDRTGVIAAVLLTVLGVPKEQVYQDYLQSNAALPAQLGRLKSAAATGLPSALSAMPIESVKILMGVDSSFLDAAFHAIDVQFGSFDAYVNDGLKLTHTGREALRARLLEPAR